MPSISSASNSLRDLRDSSARNPVSATCGTNLSRIVFGNDLGNAKQTFWVLFVRMLHLCRVRDARKSAHSRFHVQALW